MPRWSPSFWRRLPPRLREQLGRLPVVGSMLPPLDVVTPPAPVVESMWVPAGHFYSPIPDRAEVRRRRGALFASPSAEVPGIDLAEAAQLDLLADLAPSIAEHPFSTTRGGATRYYFDNDFFSFADALALHALLRHLRPRRYVEIGAGFSSAVALDTNERHLGGAMEITLIEPYPERLRELLRPGDEARVTLHSQPLHEMGGGCFNALEAGDVLFVDSSHVSKVGSDVNRIVFDIVPRLRPGVYVHFHDVFFPFEYPEAWILEGRAWNEAYLLRAFLQYNTRFQIVLWNDFLACWHREALERLAPAFLGNTGGSLWLRAL